MCMFPSKTLLQYLIENLINHPLQKELALIMSDLATIGKIISREVNRAGVAHILGQHGSVNIQGEEVQTLDVLANELCKQYLRKTGHFAALASEEEDGVVDMGEFGENAQYIIAFDPLDGSSNIDVNVSIGTIFSVHKRLPNISRTDEKQFLQKGSDQVLAGYILYGSSTVLVFSFGDGVHEFTLDQSLGEFLLSREKLRIPPKCPIYSVNESNTPLMKEHDVMFINFLKKDGTRTARYIGSLVADVHRTLIKGGIFVYPAIDAEHKGVYKGKLRLNYEAKPMALLLSQAGGLAIDGQQDILNKIPYSLHERTSLILGNADVVKEYETLSLTNNT